MKNTMKWIAVAALSMGTFAFVGCDNTEDGDYNPNTADTKQNMNDAIDKTGNAVERGVEKTGDALDRTGDKIRDGADNAGDKVENAAERTGDNMERAGDKIENSAERTENELNTASPTTRPVNPQ